MPILVEVRGQTGGTTQLEVRGAMIACACPWGGRLFAQPGVDRETLLRS